MAPRRRFSSRPWLSVFYKKEKIMQIIKGKYNQANVMIDDIDETTRAQIQGFVNNPSFHGPYIAIMPDCHAGSGSCIGFTMQMNDRIIPDVVGVDIGCGMLSRKFDIESFDIPAFDAFIKYNIPSGFAINDKVFRGVDFFTNTVKKIGMDEGRALRSIGTLGGGNHFIEAGYGADGKLWVTIHSGSRNFGLQIAKYHGNKAKELCTKWGADTQGIPFLVVDSPEGQDYIADQFIGSQYASINRETMMNKLEKFFGVSPVDSIESRHNFIDDTGMIRKGATPAHEGQRVIIPFNMRDGLALCAGNGSKKYNFSAPHGAGRILSRSKAKATLDVEYFQKDMKQAGVYTTTANAGTLDESPDAYKDMEIILKNIEETVSVIEMVKPVYNFKAGGE
jgi:RNA-splicing ligase RtcB